MARPERLLTFALLAALALTGVAVVRSPSTAERPGGTARTVRVEAKDFAFTPAAIEVNRGDRVTIELASADVVHGFHIEGYGIDLTADPGQTASVSFVADRPGTFRIRCSVPCGQLHPFMAGRLRVGPPRAYWAALLLAVAAVLVGGAAFVRRPGGSPNRPVPSSPPGCAAR